jgi:hypothetical protein
MQVSVRELINIGLLLQNQEQCSFLVYLMILLQLYRLYSAE